MLKLLSKFLVSVMKIPLTSLHALQSFQELLLVSIIDWRGCVYGDASLVATALVRVGWQKQCRAPDVGYQRFLACERLFLGGGET